MLINLQQSKINYASEQSKARLKQGRAGSERSAPAIYHYDYLLLSRLASDITELAALVATPGSDAICIDIGGGYSPYRELFQKRGYRVLTVDPDESCQPDMVGCIEQLPIESATVDLIICTQVLEHCSNPWRGVREMARVLKPEGALVFTVPHVWFYHPHPTDNYRFTQEGVCLLCEGDNNEPTGLKVERLMAQGGSAMCVLQVLCFMVFGLLGRYGAPIYAVINICAPIIDRLARNDWFCINFACLATKKEGYLDPMRVSLHSM